ncbi:homoserine dehydrogenase-domain-containing protein [Entophlyctis helioformis]|nr:homoserine dehydrogenase-domain-containing protein [Entophlyctis helioformis]
MPALNVALIGPGLVGAEFLSQLAAHQAKSAASSAPAITFNVVAIATSKRQVLSPSIPLASWRDMLLSSSSSSSAGSTSADLEALLSHAAAFSPCVLVDATSNMDVASSYPDAVGRHGLHVVTPNKKAFSGDAGLYRRIVDAASKHRKFVLHESTVGAGLPILSTLSDLVATGDEIVKIEGIFSGTLSYIFNQFSTIYSTPGPAVKFSDVVARAKELGYTEPDPRDDLNGMDVARKVVILGRVAGMDLSLDTLDVENIVPAPLRAVASADEFMAKLPEFDDHFAHLNAAALQDGSVLRYVGVVDAKGQSSVKLVRYAASHPFASLKGSDNIIAFTTKRFPNPLIIQGAGAGAAVTAFGMFSDLLKIAKSL